METTPLEKEPDAAITANIETLNSLPEKKPEGSNPVLQTPFEHIALAFSGGGFRAAAYCLGVLSFLNELKFPDHLKDNADSTLLEKVTYISSASGGSITNALFALAQAEGIAFETFYADLFNTLNRLSVLTEALNNLNNDSLWRQREHKSRNLINAFALAYDGQLLFNEKTILDLKYTKSPNLHLEEVCFNATEFYSGLPFRQQIKMKTDTTASPDQDFFYGNKVVKLVGQASEKLKLADVLAASSCFPAGFEPLIFPNDFCYGEMQPEELKKALIISPQTNSKAEEKFRNGKAIGLMDGGIDDNQGLESLMLSDERRRKASARDTSVAQRNFQPFDLMLINDVDSFYMDAYPIPKPGKKFGLSLRSVCFIAGVLLIAGSLLLLNEFSNGKTGYAEGLIVLGTVIIFVSLLFFTGVVYLYFLLHNKNNKSVLHLEKTLSPQIVNTLWGYLFKTPLSTILHLIGARFKSVFILNTDVFMKRIRQILYDKFYGTSCWKYRGKGNHIYDLAFENDINREERDSKIALNEDLQKVAQTACDMGTTLWFDDENTTKTHSLACIIATGQFTTCYNLLDYIKKLKSAMALQKAASDELTGTDLQPANTGNLQLDITEPGYLKRVDDIEASLTSYWEKFNTDPFFLYNLSGSSIPDFQKCNVKEIPFPGNYERRP